MLGCVTVANAKPAEIDKKLSVCKTIAENSRTIAEARDQGMPIETLMKAIHDNEDKTLSDYFTALVVDVYSHELETPSQIANRLATECVKSNWAEKQ